MKKLLKVKAALLALAWLLTALTQAASVPVQNMSPLALGAEYFGSMHGHEALYEFDSAAVAAHFMRLHYAPLPFLRLSAGFGGSRLYSASAAANESAKTDIGATAGLGLYIHRAFDFLTVTAGYDAYYLKAAETQNVNATTGDSAAYARSERDGYMSSALNAPYLGLIFHAGRFADIEIGGLYQRFTIIKRTRNNYGPDPGGGKPEISDAVMEQARVYGSLTLHEHESGAYLSTGASYALTNQAANNNNLQNLSVWAQIGLIMREQRGNAKGVRYSDTYDDLRWRQDRMAARLKDTRDPRPPRAPHSGGERDAQQDETDDDDVDIIIIQVGD